ncbi:MAG: hypothetical protein ABII82_06610 [Verrucomicrobiota bacterium]
MSEKNFQARYCREHDLPPELYEKVVLRQSLYPHARWLAPLIRLLNPDHFAADLDFVRNVATLTRLRDYNVEVQEFVHHPANDGPLRRTFNLRVSTKRLRRLVKATLHGDAKLTEDENHSLPPFPMKSPEKRTPAGDHSAILRA